MQEASNGEVYRSTISQVFVQCGTQCDPSCFYAMAIVIYDDVNAPDLPQNWGKKEDKG